jgi:hypothetical protein
VPPFNTAIVNGYNKLTGGKVKLGSWQHFLAMRSGVLDLNERFRDLLSNDLGAIGGLLFDIGSGRYPAPPRDEEDQTLGSWAARLEQARAEAQTLNKALQKQGESDRTHSEIQAWLRDIGLALGYDIWIASNDRGRLHDGVRLGRVPRKPANFHFDIDGSGCDPPHRRFVAGAGRRPGRSSLRSRTFDVYLFGYRPDAGPCAERQRSSRDSRIVPCRS